MLAAQPRPNVRFIPACAGNSSLSMRGATARPVHPRVCGELRLAVNVRWCKGGSSPRVRGTRDVVARVMGL